MDHAEYQFSRNHQYVGTVAYTSAHAVTEHPSSMLLVSPAPMPRRAQPHRAQLSMQWDICIRDTCLAGRWAATRHLSCLRCVHAATLLTAHFRALRAVHQHRAAMLTCFSHCLHAQAIRSPDPPRLHSEVRICDAEHSNCKLTFTLPYEDASNSDTNPGPKSQLVLTISAATLAAPITLPIAADSSPSFPPGGSVVVPLGSSVRPSPPVLPLFHVSSV